MHRAVPPLERSHSRMFWFHSVRVGQQIFRFQFFETLSQVLFDHYKRKLISIVQGEKVFLSLAMILAEFPNHNRPKKHFCSLTVNLQSSICCNSIKFKEMDQSCFRHMNLHLCHNSTINTHISLKSINLKFNRIKSRQSSEV